jgi:hypothetical protein
MRTLLFISFFLWFQTAHSQITKITEAQYNSSSSVRPTLNEVYQMSLAKLGGNTFEFYEDQYFRFKMDNGNFQIAAVGTSKSLSLAGFGTGGFGSGFPISVNTNVKGGYGTVSVGTFTTVLPETISNDYDDFMVYWVETANAPVKYRLTIQGGANICAIVERWDMTNLPTNVKITRN